MNLSRKSSPVQQVNLPNDLPDFPAMPQEPWNKEQMAAWNRSLQDWWTKARETIRRDRDRLLAEINSTRNQVNTIEESLP